MKKSFIKKWLPFSWLKKNTIAIKQGILEKIQDPCTCLLRAIDRGDLDYIRESLERGDVNIQKPIKPLITMSEWSDRRWVGINPSIKLPKPYFGPFSQSSDSGQGILHYTIANGDYEKVSRMLTLFLKAGADPNLKTFNCYSPLHYAALNSMLKELFILVEHGGDYNVRPSSGATMMRDHYQTPNVLETLKFQDPVIDGQYRQMSTEGKWAYLEKTYLHLFSEHEEPIVPSRMSPRL